MLETILFSVVVIAAALAGYAIGRIHGERRERRRDFLKGIPPIRRK